MIFMSIHYLLLNIKSNTILSDIVLFYKIGYNNIQENTLHIKKLKRVFFFSLVRVNRTLKG